MSAASGRGAGIPQQDHEALRVLVIGVSNTPVCGVRDFAAVLSRALQDRGVVVSSSWWERSAVKGFRPALREFREWRWSVARTLGPQGCDLVLWHYSAFAHSWRGIPYLAPLMSRRLRKLGTPVVVFLHEFVYPFKRSGWRGLVWALTQRLVLVVLVASSAGVVLTTEDRAAWLKSRVWLPKRPVAFVPVFSNLSLHSKEAEFRPQRLTSLGIGVLGFGSEGIQVDSIVSALGGLAQNGIDAHLVLLGSPGPDGPHGERWRRAAQEAGCADVMSFTGIRELSELAKDLAAVDVVVHPEAGGPTSRRTTLAAALAFGKPVVALDGPHTWRRFVDEGAVIVVPDSPAATLGELVSLAEDGPRRENLGRQAHEFYAVHLAPDVAARTLGEFLRSLGPRA